MQPYSLNPASPIAFGPGRLADIGKDVEAVAGAGASVVVVADPFVAQQGLAEKIAGQLRAGGHSAVVYSDVRSDPLASEIDAAAAVMRQARAAVIVAVGGGSAMDVGKLAAAVSAGPAPSEAYALCAIPLPVTTPKIICVPTTAGTGAEVTRVVVYTLGDGRKVWAWGEELRPRLALLDPLLTVSLPKGLTAATGVDALVHAIESMTNTRGHSLNDANALQAIRLVRRWLPRAVADGQDLEARGQVQIAACLAGAAIEMNGTAVAHALGHALAVVGKVHHGRAVGISLRVALPGNCQAAPERHALVAEAMGIERGHRSDADLAAALPAVYDAFLREVGLEISLASNGLSTADTDRLAETAQKPENQPMIKVNARPLEPADIRALSQAVLEAA